MRKHTWFVLAALAVLGSTPARAQEGPPCDTAKAGRLHVQPYAGMQASSGSSLVIAPVAGVRTAFELSPRFRLVGDAQMSYSRTRLRNGAVGTTGLLATAGAELDLLRTRRTALSLGLRAGAAAATYSVVDPDPSAARPEFRLTTFNPILMPELRLSRQISSRLSVDLNLQERLVGENHHAVGGITIRLHP